MVPACAIYATGYMPLCLLRCTVRKERERKREGERTCDKKGGGLIEKGTATQIHLQREGWVRREQRQRLNDIMVLPHIPQYPHPPPPNAVPGDG